MILDFVKNAAHYEKLHPELKTAFEFIQKNDLRSFAPGKHEIKGDQVFVMIQSYDTKQESEGAWEAHKKYLDIQFMIEGTEAIKIANIDKMHVKQPYNENDDYWLFTGDGDTITLEAGMYTIFFPQDVHMPSLQVNGESEPVKKAVIKVLL